MARSFSAAVVGADLTGDSVAFSGPEFQTGKQIFFRDHRENIHSTGKSGDFQAEPKELPAVIFVRELGNVLKLAPEGYSVGNMFHSSTSHHKYGTSYAQAEK